METTVFLFCSWQTLKHLFHSNYMEKLLPCTVLPVFLDLLSLHHCKCDVTKAHLTRGQYKTARLMLKVASLRLWESILRAPGISHHMCFISR